MYLNLNYFKHFLRYRFYIVFLFYLCLCLSELFHPFQFFLGIIKPDMCVDIHRHADIRMSHEVLQCLWIHSRFRHIGTIGMSTYMRSDVAFSDGIIIFCRHCKKFFVRRNNRQEYCDNPVCQKARKVQNQREFRCRKRSKSEEKSIKNEITWQNRINAHRAFHAVSFIFIILYSTSTPMPFRVIPPV